MAGRDAVHTFARIMAGLALAGVVLIPITIAILWFAPPPGVDVRMQNGISHAALIEKGFGYQLCAFAIAMITGGLQMIALLMIRRTFLEGAHGRWFSLAAVRSFRAFAWISIALVFVGVAQGVALSALMMTGDPDGEIIIAFGSNEVRALFTALIMLGVAHLFAAGRKLDEEMAGVV